MCADGPTLLLVEDDAGQASALRVLLERDYWVHRVSTEQEAAAALKTFDFDRVVWEIGLTDDGDELLAELQSAIGNYPASTIRAAIHHGSRLAVARFRAAYGLQRHPV